MTTPPHEDIRNLLGRYCELIDSGDFDGIGELLAGAVLRDETGTEVARGRDAVTALYAATTRRHADGTPRTRHVTANSIIEVDEAGGTATARSAYVVLQATGSVPLQPIVSGRYRDRFARTTDGWAFTERTITVDLVGELGDHLTFPLPS
ncbi:MAG TPA: nuclear transport factor 2 family protein [Acidimicrobiales bacterium]|nr:nuclear transport factor 2 family protein [Acidimicrobiales bacterium]